MSRLSISWMEPWYSIEGHADQVAAMGRELRREVAVGHPLFGLSVEAVARRCDCDDVLFQLLDGTGRVAVVHLTWIRQGPDHPPWPCTVIYPSFDAWVEQGMCADHEEFRNPR